MGTAVNRQPRLDLGLIRRRGEFDEAPDRFDAQCTHIIEGRIGIEQPVGPEFMVLGFEERTEPRQHRRLGCIAHFFVSPGVHRQCRRLDQIALAEQPNGEGGFAGTGFRLTAFEEGQNLVGRTIRD